MNKFDLERVMADGGKCIVRMNDGNLLPARVICTDRKHSHDTILVLVDFNEAEVVYYFNKDGESINKIGRLLNTPETYDVWITLFRNSDHVLRCIHRLYQPAHDELLKVLAEDNAEIVSILKTQMVEGENRIQIKDNAWVPLELEE